MWCWPQYALFWLEAETGSRVQKQEIMDMKQGSGGGDGGFDKMNTNFYLSNGEEIDIVIINNN